MKYYYSGGLAALSFTAVGSALALAYDAASGRLLKKAELVIQDIWPPAVPGNVEMVSLETKMCLPIPHAIIQTLQQGFLSEHRKSNTLVISGEGGIGKFDLARQVACLLRAESTKPCSTIIEISGHTRNSLETGVIEAAKKLGMQPITPSYQAAKQFLRIELMKKHRTVIIVRCLRQEVLDGEQFPIQDIISGYIKGMVRPSVSIIYTTGQADIVALAARKKFYGVSLSQAYTVKDLYLHLDNLPDTSRLKTKFSQAGTAMLPLFVNTVLENNPGYARMALPYLEESNMTLAEYIRRVQHDKQAIVHLPLIACQSTLAETLLHHIATPPQEATPIWQLLATPSLTEEPDAVKNYQRIATALDQLARFGLVRIDPDNAVVFPLMLLRQANDLITSPKITPRSPWFGWFQSAPAPAILTDTQQDNIRFTRKIL